MIYLLLFFQKLHGIFIKHYAGNVLKYFFNQGSQHFQGIVTRKSLKNFYMILTTFFSKGYARNSPETSTRVYLKKILQKLLQKILECFSKKFLYRFLADSLKKFLDDFLLKFLEESLMKNY